MMNENNVPTIQWDDNLKKFKYLSNFKQPIE